LGLGLGLGVRVRLRARARLGLGLEAVARLLPPLLLGVLARCAYPPMIPWMLQWGQRRCGHHRDDLLDLVSVRARA